MTSKEILISCLSERSYFIVGNAIRLLDNSALSNDVLKAMEQYAEQQVNTYRKTLFEKCRNLIYPESYKEPGNESRERIKLGGRT